MERVEGDCYTIKQSNGEEDEWLILGDPFCGNSPTIVEATIEDYSPLQIQVQKSSVTESIPFSLLDGEKLIESEDAVVLELCSVDAKRIDRKHTEGAENKGSIFITSFQIVFVPYEKEQPARPEFNNIPLSIIGSTTYTPTYDELSALSFQLKCKDWRLVTFKFDNTAACAKVFQQITTLAFAMTTLLYCSIACADQEKKKHIACHEFERLGLSPTEWRISHINEDYEAIPTYPAKLIVPMCISDEVLCKASSFRSNGRIPTVCWVSPSGAAIARSSQPLVGLWSARSEEDEILVRAIFCNNPNYASKEHNMYIVDCRPKLSAVGNMAKGLGYERVDCYSENCEIIWMGVDNIHAMRDSFRCMYNLCLDNQSNHHWLSNLEYTKWLDHLHLVISSSLRVAELVQQGSSVLIHCSDGWDRTPQLVSLAMLLLDPYYRTIKGFSALVEKEWISFGHKFKLRSGHGTHDFWTNDQCSPIFLQWLDCVWQITQQFPQRFEFNEKFLISLVDNVYNCRFGEFLYNNEKERHLALHNTNIASVWSHYEDNFDEFLNPFYEVSDICILSPDPSPKKLRFWTGYYLRYYQSSDEGMIGIQQQGRVLKDECSRLEHELQQMKAKLEAEARKRASLECKLTSAEQEAEELRKRTTGCKMLTQEGDTKAWYKIDLEELGLVPPTSKKLQFEIIEDYLADLAQDCAMQQLSPRSSIKDQLFSRKRSCP